MKDRPRFVAESKQHKIDFTKRRFWRGLKAWPRLLRLDCDLNEIAKIIDLRSGLLSNQVDTRLVAYDDRLSGITALNPRERLPSAANPNIRRVARELRNMDRQEILANDLRKSQKVAGLQLSRMPFKEMCSELDEYFQNVAKVHRHNQRFKEVTRSNLRYRLIAEIMNWRLNMEMPKDRKPSHTEKDIEAIVLSY